MIRIALCDDDTTIAPMAEACIDSIGRKDCTLDVFYDGKKLVDYLQANETAYNIYLMDIEMPQMGGIETSAIIRRLDRDALIIFITDHKEYVYDVFEVLPFRFLRKPVDPAELRQALLAAIEHTRASLQLFFYHIGHERHQLPYREIRYFESSGRKLLIHTTQGEVPEIYAKLSSVMGEVDKGLFAQMHVSYAVNLEQVRTIRQAEIVLADGTVLPVSQRYQKSVREQHLLFIERRCGD